MSFPEIWLFCKYILLQAELKIAHFVIDSIQTSTAYRFFSEVNPEGNDYFLWLDLPESKFVSDLPFRKLRFKDLSDSAFLFQIQNYDLVIFHSLPIAFEKILARLEPRAPVLWIGWGYDYYDLIWDSEERLFYPQTRDLIRKLKFGKSGILVSAREEVKKLLNGWGISKRRVSKLKAIKKITYFSPALESEFHFLLAKFPKVFQGVKFTDWWYSSSEFNPKELIFDDCKRDSILFGNSAYPTNNHLDALSWLNKSSQLKERKVLCPLNYGDPKYLEPILKEGKRLVGQQFLPILDVMPKIEYFRLLSSCSHAVMLHRRQQAGGTILFLVYFGTRLILPEESLLFSYLKKEGIYLNSMEELEKEPKLLTIPLTSFEINANRQKIIEIKGQVWARKQMTEFLNVIFN